MLSAVTLRLTSTTTPVVVRCLFFLYTDPVLISSFIAIANAYAALEAGATHVDTSIVSVSSM